MEEELIAQIAQNFRDLKDEKIIIYGTGKIGQRVLRALNKENVVGFLDYSKMDGFIDDVPILTWDDLHKGMADILIIAATIPHQQEIYHRIIYNSIRYDLKIYNAEGWNLSKIHSLLMPPFDYDPCYDQNLDRLMKEIDNHEKISFDLFDTILARKVLEPIDIFELVETEAKKKGILIEQFKRKRRTAELKSHGGTIYDIYRELSGLYGIDKEDCNKLLDIELQCEREMLICRQDIVIAFQYAINRGKKVSIISDMYLPACFLEEILSNLGIVGYDKIYVSCEYGKSKGDGLFDIYVKENSECHSFLHIGDNRIADGESAEKTGIETYIIKTGFELMKLSSLRGILIYADKGIRRFILGGLVADIFNSPFALAASHHKVCIKNSIQFARHFITPLAICYMRSLSKVLHGSQYKNALFAARDGYLFYKIYQKGILNPESKDIPGIYFQTSRKLALRAALNSEKMLADTDKLLGKNFLNWKNLFPEILEDVEIEKPFDQSVWKYREEIQNASLRCKRDYLNYLEKEDIQLKEKYLFCDLISLGTTHNALNTIFQKELDGFYLYYGTSSALNWKLSVYAVYERSEWVKDDNIKNILEKVFTSEAPSAKDVDSFGNILFGREYRGKEEINMLQEMHTCILNRIEEISRYYGNDEVSDKELAFSLLFLLRKVNLDSSMPLISDCHIFDDLTDEKVLINTL